MKLSIIVPAYNEERSVVGVIKDIRSVVNTISSRCEIIVVDDGSTDDTVNLVKTEGVKLIQHIYNKGYGASLKTGIEAAKGEWIAITDADGTYPVKKIPELLKYIDKYDMVVGARVGKGTKIPLLRKPAKKMLSILANFLSGRKIPDLNSGLRLFKKKDALKFFHLFPDKFSFTTTITLAYLTNNYSIKYVPIEYYRRAGKSTIHPIKDFIRFLNVIMRVITYFNPFKIFFTISLILFLLSGLVFLYTLFIVGKIMDITVIVLLLASLQIFLFGLIADLIVRSRK